MIANRGRGRMVGASSFGAAIDYIVREGPEHERDHAPPLAVWSANLASLETSALEMEATASQSRAKEPLYHLIVSWAEGERPTYEQARAALDTQIEHLGFEGLQYVAALQNDGVGGLFHVHAVFNRVDPITHVARDVWQDRDKMRAASREAELEQGWRVVDVAKRSELSHGARDVEYYQNRRSFERQVREDVGPALREAVTRDGASWADVHRVCNEHDVRYERNTLAARIADAKTQSAQYDEWIMAVNIGVDVMTTMIKDMPEATDLFIAEEDRLECERAEAERKKAAVASALAALDEHYGVTHAMGSVETDYSRSLLLGAVDMNGKRYARLERSLGRVLCVPWIDAFAELVGRMVSVYWSDRAKDDRVFHVTMPTATSTKKKNDAVRRFSRFEMSSAGHRLDTRAVHTCAMAQHDEPAWHPLLRSPRLRSARPRVLHEGFAVSRRC